jgi:plastocyanin
MVVGVARPSPCATVLALLALAAALALACGDDGDDRSAPTSSPAPTATAEMTFAPGEPVTFRVLAGATDGALDLEQFMPATVRIREGDTITWAGRGFEGHTVTFFPHGVIDIGFDEYLVPAPDMAGAREFNPMFALASDAQGSYDGTEYVNSGFFGVPAPQEYTLTFPRQGVYPYVCMVHPLHMRGAVIVDPAGARVPSPESVAAEGEREKQRYIEEGRAAIETAERVRRAANEAAAGRTWEVSVGIDTPHAQVLSFVPGALEIDRGDKIVFWNSERDFHNVIFAPEGSEPPQFPILKAVEGRGGFRLLINPDAEREIPPPADLGPDALFSSGLMGIGFPRFYYEVTFAKPGRYTYYCTVHTLAGMAGSITVQ